MGTKNKPGDYDCFAKLADGEPYFVLRAQDVYAPEIVRYWAQLASQTGCAPAKVEEARFLADAMEAWPVRKVPD